MVEAAVQEHMGDELVRPEIRRAEVVQGEHLLDVESGAVLKNILGEEHQCIDNDQVFDHCGDEFKSSRPEFGHT
jgi:hypothetical protein